MPILFDDRVELELESNQSALAMDWILYFVADKHA